LSDNRFLFNALLLNIETVPQVSEYSKLTALWQHLFENKITKVLPETVNTPLLFRQKAGLFAEFGKIICISTAFFYKDAAGRLCLKLKSIYGEDENKLLNDLILLIDKFIEKRPNFLFAGHNIREFDIPFICRRMVINQIKLPRYLPLQGAKPWEVNMLDTTQWWKFGDYKNYISLKLLAGVLNIEPAETDMDGSMVYDAYYMQNDLQRIVKYSQRNIITTAQIILRFKNLPLIDPQHIISAE
jgi:hypothetical protein